MQKPQVCPQEAPGETKVFVFFSRGLITQPQIEQLMNLTAVAAAVALAVWEIRASKQQIGRTVTSVKQGQISHAGEGGKSDSVVSVHRCGFKTTAPVLGRLWVWPAGGPSAGGPSAGGPSVLHRSTGRLSSSVISRIFDLMIKMRRSHQRARWTRVDFLHIAAEPLPAEAPDTVGRRQAHCKSFTSQ